MISNSPRLSMEWCGLSLDNNSLPVICQMPLDEMLYKNDDHDIYRESRQNSYEDLQAN